MIRPQRLRRVVLNGYLLCSGVLGQSPHGNQNQIEIVDFGECTDQSCLIGDQSALHHGYSLTCGQPPRRVGVVAGQVHRRPLRSQPPDAPVRIALRCGVRRHAIHLTGQQQGLRIGRVAGEEYDARAFFEHDGEVPAAVTRRGNQVQIARLGERVAPAEDASRVRPKKLTLYRQMICNPL
jgi:hypothetical protein